MQAISVGPLLGGSAHACVKVRISTSLLERCQSATGGQGSQARRHVYASSTHIRRCDGDVSSGTDYGSASQEMSQLLQERMSESSSLPTTVSGVHDKPVGLKG
ncbi:hypothetical protein MTO96_005395 [Rhipicephalus appendiculatus]